MWVVQNRCRLNRTKCTCVVDGERPTTHLFCLQTVLTRSRCNVLKGHGETFNVLLIRLANDRYVKGVVCRDGYREMDVLVNFDVISCPLRVHHRILLQCFDGSLHEERHERQFDTFPFHELVFQFRTGFNEVRHIHFNHEPCVWRLVFRADHIVRNRLTYPGCRNRFITSR